jgi:hypothetical protein
MFAGVEIAKESGMSVESVRKKQSGRIGLPDFLTTDGLLGMVQLQVDR